MYNVCSQYMEQTEMGVRAITLFCCKQWTGLECVSLVERTTLPTFISTTSTDLSEQASNTTSKHSQGNIITLRPDKHCHM